MNTEFIAGTIEFKQEELVDREIEIACCLLLDYSLLAIVKKTGLNKKILVAHLRNMMEKLQVNNIDELLHRIKEKQL